MTARRRVTRPWSRIKQIATRKSTIFIAVMALLALLAIPIVTYAYYAHDIADRERLMNRNNTGVVILDRHGEVIYNMGQTNHGGDAKISEVPEHFKQALLASEDLEFYEHPGYSLKGMAVALYANVMSKDLTRYGGSTLTQQLVKNTLLSSSKNFMRKYQELAVAIAVDRHYSKDEILEMYINSVYFGEGAFGLRQAAKTYFDKSPEQLTLAESSMLVGLLPAPSTYSPISGDAEQGKKQQERVLSLMVEAGFIKEDVKEQTLSEQLAYHTSEAEVQQAMHFTLMVMDDLKKRYGEEKATRSGYQVTTGLDLKWQKQTEEHVRQRVAQLASQGGRNASVVAIDPKNGEVRALVGSVDWDNDQFGKVNMAISPRQPGSSFKPIFYSEALAKRLITPATMIEDKPKTYGGTYSPQNYDFKYQGQVPIRQALALSKNIPAVEVMQKLGPAEASQAAQRMGISTVNEPDKYGLSLALGTAEARLLDMTNAYAALAGSGRQFAPTLITSIKDKYGKQVFKNRPVAKEVIDKNAAFLISSILSDVQARGSTFASLNISGRQVAAKTGTTDKNHDAWTIGYTPNMSVGVWLGNNENEAMSGVAGASGAGPIWRRSMEFFLRELPKENFVAPPNIVKATVCRSNGMLATRTHSGTYEEYFIRGSLPTGKCESEQRREEPKKKEEEPKPEEKKPEEKKEEKPEGGQGGGPLEENPVEPDAGGEEEEEEEATESGGTSSEGDSTGDTTTNSTSTQQ